jgi:CRISPR-associated endonuclease/helicase Cas3
MMVTFVSQCEKKALVRTRRVLDAFAERIGDRTWQTVMTEDGLVAVRSLLKKTVTKNTAVACHWMRSRSRSELLWVVGQRHAFNPQGVIPVNTTQKNLLVNDHLNNWHSAEQLTLITRLAALFHDFGKANAFFAAKLEQRQAIADPYRHEWVSLRLFEAFVQQHAKTNPNAPDQAWLTALAEKNPDLTWLNQVIEDSPHHQPNDTAPLIDLPPLAQMVGWLIVTHHRLPINVSFEFDIFKNKRRSILSEINVNSCYPNQWGNETAQAKARMIQQCWEIPAGHLPMCSQTWQAEAARCANRLLSQPLLPIRLLDDPYLSHVGRLVLMLADHHYSSCAATPQFHDRSYPCYANTDADGKLKQPLDDHLIGVNHAVRQLMGAIRRLPDLFPRLDQQKKLEIKNSPAAYRWQDTSYQLAVKHRIATESCGFFGVNLASTGRGKTLANARIMYGLADPERGARFSVAMGLRTLTLQTGQAYRQRLGLTKAELAILVGGGAVQELFEQQQRATTSNQQHHDNDKATATDESNPLLNPQLAEQMGSESLAELFDDGLTVDFEGILPSDHLLTQWLSKQPKIRDMLLAPLLCCTIDHLIPATESTRGGRQIAPMLRLMSSDLILDEPDDFSPDDWYALARLVYWAGLLGSRVLLSSATLTAAEVNGLFVAYQEGRQAYNKHRQPDAPAEIICGWFDEYDQDIRPISTIEADTRSDNGLQNKKFAAAHNIFTKKRAEKLAVEPQRRKLAWVGLEESTTAANWLAHVSERLHQTLHLAHQHNALSDPISQKNYSIGLIRFANIDRLAEVAQQLAALAPQPNTRLHLCVYHSRFPLLVRSSLEQQLDGLLNRHPTAAHHQHPLLRRWLDQYPEQQQIVVILASPVAEVGRDHDYDWMIVEPSSMRSIIQVVGRVRRHRPEPYEHPNVFLMETNIRHLKKPKELAFTQPGFECDSFRLTDHWLPRLLDESHQTRLDATARLRRPDAYRRDKLADLEHERMSQIMLARGLATDQICTQLPVAQFWQDAVQLTGLMQQQTRFRKSGQEALVAFKAVDEHQDLELHEFNPKTGSWLLCNGGLERPEVDPHPQVSLWPCLDQVTLLQRQQEHRPDQNWEWLCKRYLSLSLPLKKRDGAEQQWSYHDWFGFIRRRN